MLGFEKEMFKSDPFTGILETQIEEMKKHREALEEKQKEYKKRCDEVVAVLDGLTYEEAEYVLEGTKNYLRTTLIVKKHFNNSIKRGGPTP